MLRMKLPLLLSLLLGATAACSSGPNSADSCDGDKCDAFDLPESEIEATPCDGVLVDKSGRGIQGKLAGRLTDPLAKLVFRSGDDCPVGFRDIMEKLTKAPETDGFSCDNLRTMVVSETAQALQQETNYRAVTALDCEQPAEGIVPPGFGSQPPGILFSLFGVRAGDDLPDSVELIAFDKSTGVFNYYETDGREINFFGNSKDMLKGTGSAGDRRCAACHTGGGLVMKELASPWVHWEGDTDTPGADDLIANNEDLLGDHSDGIDMEDIVRASNDSWNQARLATLIEQGNTQEILRPLFCTVEVNLESANSFDDGTSKGTADFFNLSGTVYNNRLGFGGLNGNSEEYDAILRANGQTIEGLPGEHIDTVFSLTTVVPGEADQNYINLLVEEGIIDTNLANDVLSVDFTRAIFSEDRCELLNFVPTIEEDDLNPKTITEAILAELGSPATGSPADELKKNLENEEDQSQALVSAFDEACEDRTETESITFSKDGSSQTMDVPSVLRDYMRVVSLNRREATNLSVFEFPQTMPTDSQSVASGTRFHPTTCELTREFVPVANTVPSDPADPIDESCCRICGPNSQACGDSCISLDNTCSQPTGCACEG